MVYLLLNSNRHETEGHCSRHGLVLRTVTVNVNSIRKKGVEGVDSEERENKEYLPGI